MAAAELSRTGARSTQAPTVSLTDAVQAMTASSLTGGNVYAPTANLPRDPLDTGPFGPLAPLFIQAINPPRVDTDRPEPRVWEYPQGFNLPGGGDRLLPWEVLRAASTNVDVVRRCIEIRKDDVRALRWAWTVSEDAIKTAMQANVGKAREDVEADLRTRYASDIARLTGFWKRPWITNGVRFGQWVAAVMEDHIALDAVAIYPVTSVGGDVIAFRVVDGATIKLLINAEGERPQPPHPAFQQKLYGFPRGEFIADVVLREDGTEDESSTYTASQITYWRENFRTYTPYGFSQVEQALVSAALYLKRQGWMHAEYDEGSTPLTWLVPQGDKFTANQLSPAQRREYETAINDDMSGQTGRRHRIKVAYPGFEPIQMDSVDERYKPEYDLFLLKLVASHLGVTLDRLGFTEAKGLGATGQHERQAEVQDDSGVNPDAAMLTDLIMELSRNYLDCPADLTFEFIRDKAEDEAAKDAIWTARRARGAATQNEDRKANGLAPLDIPEADMPSMVTATGIVYIEGGREQQDAMAQLAANPPAPAAAGGTPLGGQGGDAGGSRPKPSGPKPTGPRNKAAAADELVAYRRWLRKNLDGAPRRPFRFEHAEPDAVALAGHELDGALQAFDGYEWRVDITKDWRSWNAAHPLHPRGPHGRFVKVGNLVDELRRIHGPLSEHHENVLDEATRRVHAARPFRRGERPDVDELERRGLLEEYGGVGGNKNRLELSEAGRRHLQARDAEPAPDVPDATPDVTRAELDAARADLVAEYDMDARAAGALDEDFVPEPAPSVTDEQALSRVRGRRANAAAPVRGEIETEAERDLRETTAAHEATMARLSGHEARRVAERERAEHDPAMAAELAERDMASMGLLGALARGLEYGEEEDRAPLSDIEVIGGHDVPSAPAEAAARVIRAKQGLSEPDVAGIREAYQAAGGSGSAPVSLANLRARLGATREQQDALIEAMMRDRTATLLVPGVFDPVEQLAALRGDNADVRVQLVDIANPAGPTGGLERTEITGDWKAGATGTAAERRATARAARLAARAKGTGTSVAEATPKATPAPSVSRDISSSLDYEALPELYDLKTYENSILKEIVRQQGGTELPQVVSRSDFDAALARGEVRETWRGVSAMAGSTARELAERYRSGDFYVGQGINGDGTYVALHKADTESYGEELLRIGLRKDAKVISANDLDVEMDAFFSSVPKSEKLRQLDDKLRKDLAAASTDRARANIRRKYRSAVYGLDVERSIEVQRDPGIFAALRGYDAIEIPKDRSPDKHDEMIILNRAATIVEESDSGR